MNLFLYNFAGLNNLKFLRYFTNDDAADQIACTQSGITFTQYWKERVTDGMYWPPTLAKRYLLFGPAQPRMEDINGTHLVHLIL